MTGNKNEQWMGFDIHLRPDWLDRLTSGKEAPFAIHERIEEDQPQSTRPTKRRRRQQPQSPVYATSSVT
jgi:hypothetical protein